MSNNWHVADWTSVEPFTCQKIDSEGCDVLTAKIFRYWLEYNQVEDFSLQGGSYLVSLYTKKCQSKGSEDCVTEQYNKENVWLIDVWGIDSAFQTLVAGSVALVLLALV